MYHFDQSEENLACLGNCDFTVESYEQFLWSLIQPVFWFPTGHQPSAYVFGGRPRTGMTYIRVFGVINSLNRKILDFCTCVRQPAAKCHKNNILMSSSQSACPQKQENPYLSIQNNMLWPSLNQIGHILPNKALQPWLHNLILLVKITSNIMTPKNDPKWPEIWPFRFERAMVKALFA